VFVHTALSAQQFLATKNVAVIPHPPFLPDLAPLIIFFFIEEKIADIKVSFPGCC